MASDFLSYAYQFFMDKGYSPQAAAAMAGNANAESTGNPGAVGDNGLARGLFQWHPDRYAKLQDWANRNNLDPNTVDTQLGFADYELRNGEKSAGTKLFGAKDLGSANDAMMAYLRPAGYSADNPQGGDNYVGRYNDAASILNLPGMTQTFAMAPTKFINGPGPGAGQSLLSDQTWQPSGTLGGNIPVASKTTTDNRRFNFGALGKGGLDMIAKSQPSMSLPPIQQAPLYRPQQAVNLLDIMVPRNPYSLLG